MTSETVTIEVPQTLYRRLERLAALTHRPLESLVTQTLLSSLPPLPDDLSPALQDALVAIEPLGDDDLMQIVYSTFPEAQYEQLAALRERRRAVSLRQGFRNVRSTLQGAYRLVWRGSPSNSPFSPQL